jgi:hypothetical protein
MSPFWAFRNASAADDRPFNYINFFPSAGVAGTVEIIGGQIWNLEGSGYHGKRFSEK